MKILDGYMGYWLKFLISAVDKYTGIYITASSAKGMEKRDYIINSIKRNVKN